MVGGQSVVAHTLDALALVRRLSGTLVVLSPSDVAGATTGATTGATNGTINGAATDATSRGVNVGDIASTEDVVATSVGEDSAFPQGKPKPVGRSSDMTVTSAFSRAAPAFRGWTAAVGGATRAQTVANGLKVLVERGARPIDWVLVHDAARCLVRPEWIDALIDACLDDEVGGLLAMPLPDTLKSEHEGRVLATLDRKGKWAAQTPQMFRLGMLADALAAAGASITDEASAIEAAGHAPKLVPGSLENFKITWPADFALAERLLRTR
ncbi:MAG: 2-C-methyl-D-erythritol 4-phosphate cytidylyltransferase [Rhizobacter sp.]|nr:2-C-methyl-D-erythritol 4-phosphate cytidylyltransferase [Rhizobacter sp.]